MTTNTHSTRRRFLGQAGAAVAVPLAAAAPLGGGAREAAADTSAARLAVLEDLNAIRALQRAYAQLVNADAHEEAARLFVEPASAPRDTGVRRLVADMFAANDAVELAPDGRSATARLECTVEIETVIDGQGTLLDMLRQQGEGTRRTAEPRVLEARYVKRRDTWRIASLALSPA
jgi:hypothetical protein